MVLMCYNVTDFLIYMASWQPDKWDSGYNKFGNQLLMWILKLGHKLVGSALT